MFQTIIVYIVSCLLPIFSSCTSIPTVPTAEPIKTFTNSEAYFYEGKMNYDKENYQEAVRYFKEAIRLDPANQQAHALAGVAYTKIGMWSDARREFDETIKLKADSPEGKQAQGWIKRLSQPTSILVLPFIYYSDDNNQKVIANASYKTLNNYLVGCGLYNVLGPKGKSIENYTSQNEEVNLPAICQFARENDVKLIVSGIINGFEMRQDMRPSFSEIGKIFTNLGYKPPPEHSKYFTATLKLTLKVYETKNCRLVHTVTDQKTFEKVSELELDNAVQQVLNVMFDSMFKEINAKII